MHSLSRSRSDDDAGYSGTAAASGSESTKRPAKAQDGPAARKAGKGGSASGSKQGEERAGKGAGVGDHHDDDHEHTHTYPLRAVAAKPVDEAEESKSPAAGNTALSYVPWSCIMRYRQQTHVTLLRLFVRL